MTGRAQLADLIAAAVAGLGYELVDVETSPRARLLRVFIDRPATAATPQAGSAITVDDCEAVSHHLTHLFAVENVDYDRLEVSSPGLDRPLKKPADFRRFTGAEVQLKLRVPLGIQRNFSGVLVACDEEGVTIATAAGEHRFAYAAIDKARLVPKFEFRALESRDES